MNTPLAFQLNKDFALSGNEYTSCIPA